MLKWIQEGAIEHYYTSGKHARIDSSSLRAYLFGEVEEEQVEDKKGEIAIYARTSSESQKESLDRQVERLLGEVSARENLSPDSIPVYKDIASSFGSRESLNRLVDAIIEGKVKKIYCEYLDRLSRVPALTRLLEHLCDKFGVEIICLDVEDSEPQEIYQKELLGFLTVWCNRQSAAKSRKVTFKEVSPECIEKIIQLRQTGLTVKQIKKEVDKEGWKTSKGDSISYDKLLKIVDSNGTETALTRIVKGPSADKLDEVLKEFVAKRVKKNENSRLSCSDLYPVYVQFCENRGLKALPNNVVGRTVAKMLDGQRVKIGGVRYIKGFSLN